ncbi:hypothetical protein [Streptomyces sp. NPDC058434]|uniref:hypothetical protein n=1 Tax=Streptomyces sp. NPDC058434 TaxID=3346498 RepID=UPI003656E959
MWPTYVDLALNELGPATETYIGQIANEHVDWFAPFGREDLVLRYARAVPIDVASGLLGMGERYAADLGQSLSALVDGTLPPDRAQQALSGVCRQLVVEKQAMPGPDLVSWMLHHAPAGRRKEVARQTQRLLLGITVSATTRIALELSRRLPSPGSPAAETDQDSQRDGTGDGLPEGGTWIVGLLVRTAVDRLLVRLPDLRLRMPLSELLWEPLEGVRFPRSLPAVFTPVRVRYGADEDIAWLPEPIFTTTPPH